MHVPMNPTKYITDRLRKYDKAELVPEEDFNEIVANVQMQFKLSAEEASKLFHKLAGPDRVAEPRPIGVGKEHVWPAMDRANGTRPRPGLAAEPKSSLHPLSSNELVNIEKGNRVYMLADDSSPWGAAYNGVIILVNRDNTLDILDEDTGAMHQQQRRDLARLPRSTSPKDVRDQSRRVGDPAGMMDGQKDVGSNSSTRSRTVSWDPMGQEGKGDGTVYPVDGMFKEADYSELLNKIVKEYGISVTENVVKYLRGEVVKPSLELKAVLRRYDLERMY